MIARTLGVIDDTKAATSDKGAMLAPSVPTLLIPDDAPAALSPASPHLPSPSAAALHATHNDPHAHAHFFNPAEEHSLKLSGVGVFSPAASRPPSPHVRRKMELPPASAESDAESFTIVEREEEAAPLLRRRAQRAEDETR